MYSKMQQEEQDRILERLNREKLPFPGYEFVWDKNHMKHMGSGGFASVYECNPKSIWGDKMAVKVIGFQTPVIEDPKVILKYLSEVEIQKKVTCREVVRIQDASVLRIEFDDEEKIKSVKPVNVRECKVVENAGLFLFILMEKLQPVKFSKGHSMDLIDQLKDPTEAEIYRFAINIGRALQIAHTCEGSFIHRDVKPENIFWDEINSVYKLGDFGIARTVEVDGTYTEGIGTKAYMAPEVICGGKYDVRADIYSYGMTLYRLLNNEWRNPKFYDRELEPELPMPSRGSKELCKIVLKACSYNRENRYDSMSELLDELKALSEKSKVLFDNHMEAEPIFAEHDYENDIFKLNLTCKHVSRENEGDADADTFAEMLDIDHAIENKIPQAEAKIPSGNTEKRMKILENALGKNVHNLDTNVKKELIEVMFAGTDQPEKKIKRSKKDIVWDWFTKILEKNKMFAILTFLGIVIAELCLGQEHSLNINRWQNYVVIGLSGCIMVLKSFFVGFCDGLDYGVEYLFENKKWPVLKAFCVIASLFAVYCFGWIDKNWLYILMIWITLFTSTPYQWSITLAMVVSCVFSKYPESFVVVQAIFDWIKQIEGKWLLAIVILLNIIAGLPLGLTRRERRRILNVGSIFSIGLIVFGIITLNNEGYRFIGRQLPEILLQTHFLRTGLIGVILTIINRLWCAGIYF